MSRYVVIALACDVLMRGRSVSVAGANTGVVRWLALRARRKHLSGQNSLMKVKRLLFQAGRILGRA
jgi:hypothetical protein